MSAVLLAAGLVGGLALAHQFGDVFAPASSSAKPTDAKSEPPSDLVTLSPEKQSAAGIETAAVAAEPLAGRVWRTGRVTLDEERVAHVSPPTEGVVRDAPARLGQTVAAGDVLAVLESREFSQAKVELLKARIALAAERELAARTKTTMANAGELLDLLAADATPAAIDKALKDKPIGDWRSQLLSAYTKRNHLKAEGAAKNTSPGVISEMAVRKTAAELEAAESAYTALVEEFRFQAKNQVRLAELKLKDAETAFDVARVRLLLFGLTPDAVDRLDPVAEGATASHLTIKAPFAGTVIEKHAVLSERVGPQSQLFVLADLSNVWVQADVFEPDLHLARDAAGKSIAFRPSLDAGTERTAKVLHAGDVLDKASRALTLTAVAPNADHALKPGMFVEVGIDSGDHTPVVQVPAAAVLRHENKPFVFVQQSADTFRRVAVTPGRTSGDRVEIVEGLKAGDRVVVRGGFTLKSELLKDLMVGE
ncbi:efflux RND transporter periplasmic adaptor subunit [Limnoglobus roseus]|uniref:efflux RND transporter periplasmic adaptor subunit n=1 Tax=Limnoglobus roseus TaxID=2598579 RepID=UPI00143E058D|nr:efflux RND transporter periplasmic adaptor subunit [Limnoglobus roseus]